MPKNTPAVGKNWGVEVNLRNAEGKIIYNEKAKPQKTKIKMANGFFADGTPQNFYFGPTSDRPGVFKGMAVILRERGINITYVNDRDQVKELKAQCPGFHCPPDNLRCCCRRILYNQPDFTNGLSLLELAAEERGFRVLFLPKFHCELNFIEMCWGKAKRIYQLNPPSSKEEDVEKNMLAALDAVTVTDMRK
jgi:hypothetical protein